MGYCGKNILVVGAARSGISAAGLLNKLGANVTLADRNNRESLSGGIGELERSGVALCLGRNAGLELVKRQSLIVSSPGIPPEMETFELARAEGIPIMGEMELAFTLCLCPVAAITGTNGKTTTTALAGEIIGKHIKNTKIAGNIGAPFTECVTKLDGDSFAVIEASSFQLESISVFKPKISAILNVTPDHLDRHKTLERYIESKTNVFKYTDSGCTVILNREDAVLRALKVDTGAKILYFSDAVELNEGAYLQNGEIVLKYNGGVNRLISVDELQIPGAHNVQNALAATLIAACAGVPAEIIANALRQFKGVPHRIEFVRELNGVKYYNDSKGTNPEATAKALEAMSGKTVLIAGGFDRGADFVGLTALFGQRLSHLIALGQTRDRIISSCRSVGFEEYTVVGDYAKAVRVAAQTAKKGENVLLSPACASWDMFADFEQRGDCFKKLVMEL